MPPLQHCSVALTSVAFWPLAGVIEISIAADSSSKRTYMMSTE
jgi:hypothetical protein